MVGNRRAETELHSVLKFLVASILERQGHKVSIEFKLSPGFDNSKIADVFDHTSCLIYEIQTKRQREIEKTKARDYTKRSGVNDVIFIYTKNFDITMGTDKIIEILKKRIG